MGVYLGSSELASYYQGQGGGGNIYLGNCLVWPVSRYIPYEVNSCTIFYDSLSCLYPCIGGTNYRCCRGTYTLDEQGLVCGTRCYYHPYVYVLSSGQTISYRECSKFCRSIHFSRIFGGDGNGGLISACSYIIKYIGTCGACFYMNNSAWHNYVLTMGDGYVDKFYVDGQLCTSTSRMSLCACKGNGWVSVGNGGKAGDIIMENKTRSPEEVLQYYNNSKARFNAG